MSDCFMRTHTPQASYHLREGNSFNIKNDKKTQSQTLENCSCPHHLTLWRYPVGLTRQRIWAGSKGHLPRVRAPGSISSRQASRPSGEACSWPSRVEHGFLLGFWVRLGEQPFPCYCSTSPGLLLEPESSQSGEAPFSQTFKKMGLSRGEKWR